MKVLEKLTAEKESNLKKLHGEMSVAVWQEDRV